MERSRKSAPGRGNDTGKGPVVSGGMSMGNRRKPGRLRPHGVGRTGSSVPSLGGLAEEVLLEAKTFVVGKSLGGCS